jgi:hypothetical protein
MFDSKNADTPPTALNRRQGARSRIAQLKININCANTVRIVSVKAE